MSLAQKLSALLTGPKLPSSQTLRSALAQARQDHEQARDELSRARRAYDGTLLDANPDTSHRAREHVATIQVSVDRCGAAVEALEARAQEAERVERLAAATAARETLEADIRDYVNTARVEFDGAASAIVELMRRTALLQQNIDRFNANRPPGTAPLPNCEMLARGGPVVEPRVVETERFDSWIYASSGNLVAPDDVPRVVIDRADPRKGVVSHKVRVPVDSPSNGRGLVEQERQHPVVLIAYEIVTREQGQARPTTDALATVVVLPGFGAFDTPWFTPGPSPIPEVVLAKIAEREAADASNRKVDKGELTHKTTQVVASVLHPQGTPRENDFKSKLNRQVTKS